MHACRTDLVHDECEVLAQQRAVVSEPDIVHFKGKAKLRGWLPRACHILTQRVIVRDLVDWSLGGHHACVDLSEACCRFEAFAAALWHRFRQAL